MVQQQERPLKKKLFNKKNKFNLDCIYPEKFLSTISKKKKFKL